MARFKYNGEPPRPGLVATYGNSIKFRLHLKDGSVQELTPVPPATKFEIGQDIGYEITDERAIRHMTADSRFTRLS